MPHLHSLFIASLPLADLSEWGIMVFIPILAIAVAMLIIFILKRLRGTHTPRQLE